MLQFVDFVAWLLHVACCCHCLLCINGNSCRCCYVTRCVVAGSNKMHAIFVPFMHARVRVCVFWCVNWMLNTCGVCVLSHTISVGDVCFSHFFVRKTKRIRKLTIILLTEVRLCGVCCVCLFFLNNFPHYFILFLNSLSRILRSSALFLTLSFSSFLHFYSYVFNSYMLMPRSFSFPSFSSKMTVFGVPSSFSCLFWVIPPWTYHAIGKK